MSVPATGPYAGPRLAGSLHGGQQPISGATVQLYAVGTNGNGTVSVPLLAHATTTDSSGAFGLPAYTCPSPSTEVYLLATGGNPGFSSGATNQALSLMSMLGPCGALSASTFVQINEVTTIGSIWPVATYMSSAPQVGFADALQFISARSTVAELVSIGNGSAPGPDLPAGSSAPVSKLNTLANLIAGCVNSSGGVAGDGSICGSLFAATTAPGGIPPTDTIAAALQIAKNPTAAYANLLNLIAGQSPFQPMLAVTPPDWTLPILSPPVAPQIGPAGGSYSSAQTITISEATAGASVYYTLDGSTPSASSSAYTSPITLSSSGTMRAVAFVGALASPVASSTYNIAPSNLVFVTQPSFAAANTILAPGVQVAVEDAAGNVVSTANGVVTLELTGGSSQAVLSGATVATFINGVASFSSLSIAAPAAGYVLSATTLGYSSLTSSSFSIGSPLILLSPSSTPLTLGHTVSSTVSLGQPAPAGGVTVSLASSNSSIMTVYPSTVVISAGLSSGSFTYSSVTPGTASVLASATGYSSGTLSPASTPSLVPLTLFGMSINKPTIEQLNMPYSFGTTRTWDVYPELDWSDSNPAPGVYNFANLDTWIAYTEANSNADIIYTLGRTPQWASSQPNVTSNNSPGACAPPANLQDWDNYITAIATHTLGKIHLWEIWNEPQDPLFYCGDVPTMILLAQHAQQIIKSIDPSAIILSPSPTGGYGPQWMNSFLQAGGGNYVDVLAFHGYWSGTAEDLTPIIANYRALMNTYGVATKPLWDTEASWNGANPPTSYADRAAFVLKYYFLHWSLGVDRFLWYEYDGGQWGGLWDDVSGIHPDGVAYGQAQNWLVGANISTACSANSFGTWTCDVTRSGGYRARVIWNSTNTVQYTPDASFVQYRDLTGAVTTLTGGAIPVGNQPLLLETGGSPYPL